MRRSYNEIAGILRKAAMGAGFPAGLAEDAAMAGEWLARCDVDGVRCVLAGIAAGMPRDVELPSASDDPVFANARVAVDGPCAIDLVLAGNADRRVTLAAADAPWMMIGTAGRAAYEHRQAFELGFSSGAKAAVLPYEFQLSGDVPAAPCDIVVSLLAGQGDFGEPANSGRGADVDVDVWAKAAELASKTYVPATEASRVLGAGAGLTDND